MKQNKNYMDLMDEFFIQTEKLSDNATNNEIVELLQKNKSLINDIANLTKETKLFQRSYEKYKEFKAQMLEKKEDEKQIIFAYGQLLEKIANAPTYLHMRSVIVLLMPLLADSLDSMENAFRKARKIGICLEFPPINTELGCISNMPKEDVETIINNTSAKFFINDEIKENSNAI